ncbi:hypothetical protein D3C77_303270 [compost metagenome]
MHSSFAGLCNVIPEQFVIKLRPRRDSLSEHLVEISIISLFIVTPMSKLAENRER